MEADLCDKIIVLTSSFFNDKNIRAKITVVHDNCTPYVVGVYISQKGAQPVNLAYVNTRAKKAYLSPVPEGGLLTYLIAKMPEGTTEYTGAYGINN